MIDSVLDYRVNSIFEKFLVEYFLIFPRAGTGLFRHYWVMKKFLITAVAALILFMYARTLSHLRDWAADTILSIDDVRNPPPVLHSGLALLALLLATTLSVYKRLGITRYGRRKEREQRKKS